MDKKNKKREGQRLNEREREREGGGGEGTKTDRSKDQGKKWTTGGAKHLSLSKHCFILFTHFIGLLYYFMKLYFLFPILISHVQIS